MESQFLRAQRIWRAAKCLKRSGQMHNIDQFFPFRYPGSVCVPCFSCPTPGFNVPDSQWEEDDTGFEHLNTLFLMEDGHHGLQRLGKVDDPDDVSLLADRGFFPEDEEFNRYVAAVVLTSDEKSTCSKFNAIEMQNKLKFKGCVITGVLAVECGRHAVFLAMVDMQKGERYALADYALARALYHFISTMSLRNAKIFFRRIIVTYDVACQYFVKLKERFRVSFAELSDVVDIIRMLVPKMHLDGHKEDCRYRFSLNYSEGAGRVHGEGIETSWAESKQSGGSTRQMNHGHRHDTINDFHNYWNWEKIHKMPQSLKTSLVRARKARDELITNYTTLSAGHSRSSVESWSKESTEAHLENGEWRSVYRLKLRKLPTQDEILHSFANETAEFADGAHQSGTSITAVAKMVHKALDIQEKQRDLKRFVASNNDPEDVKKKRTALLSELQRWRKQQAKATPGVVPSVVQLDSNVEVEDENLCLPSDFDISERERLGLLDASVCELKLRQGEANSAVAGICSALRHENLLLATKAREAQGIYQNLRSLSSLNTVKARKKEYAARYRAARIALLRLNNLPDHSRMDEYPRLQDKDMFQKNAAKSRELGDGKLTDSWIWSYGNLRGMTSGEKAEFLAQADRVHWFRTRADMFRWIEEVEILEEDFRRYIRACESMSSFWGSVPKRVDDAREFHIPGFGAPLTTDGTLSGYSVYAAEKADMYSRMAINARALFELADGTWPDDGERLVDHVAAKRPSLEIPWGKGV
ncbi:hypothetical protein MD484_g7609, partial [Candolleomyces efflorescens]